MRRDAEHPETMHVVNRQPIGVHSSPPQKIYFLAKFAVHFSVKLYNLTN